MSKGCVLLIIGFLLCLNFARAETRPVTASATEKNMLLIGGALKICSSYSQKNCQTTLKVGPAPYTNAFYSVDNKKVSLIESDPYKVFESNTKKLNLINLLKKYQLRHSKEPQTRRDLVNLLDDIKLSNSQLSGRKILQALNPQEEDFVFQYLQNPKVDQQGHELTEYVDLENSQADSQRIVQKFVNLVKKTSGKSRPLILVSTASSNDVFDAVSFYIQLFKTFDVEVAWFPIEASLLQVMQDTSIQCSELNNYRSWEYSVFNRQAIYPQLASYQQAFCENPQYFEALLDKASGLFFNGGDQFLTLSSLAVTKTGSKKFSSLYQMIKSKFDLGKLVVAGTSAGTAVQSGGILNDRPIPMVTNGESIAGIFTASQAVDTPPGKLCEYRKDCGMGIGSDSLTVFKPGGFNFVSIGLIDTHFSRRDRAFRMLRLLADYQINSGFGVDENTALHIEIQDDKTKLETIGEGAVWRFEMSQKNVSKISKDLNDVKIVAAFDENIGSSIIHRLGNDVISRLIAQSVTKGAIPAESIIKSGAQKAKVIVRAEEKRYEFSIQLDILKFSN